MKMNKLALALSLSAALFASPSLAAPQLCTSKVLNIYVGDQGRVVINFQSGISAFIQAADPDVKNSLSLATSALLADKTITVRYETTLGSAVCNPASGADYSLIAIDGIYLNAN